MVIWKGLGILVPVQFFVILVTIQAGVDAVWGQGFYTATHWPKQTAVIVASISLLPVGLWLNRNQNVEEAEAISEPPPREPARHTLFFVPYQHWTWAGFGLLLLWETSR